MTPAPQSLTCTWKSVVSPMRVECEVEIATSSDFFAGGGSTRYTLQISNLKNPPTLLENSPPQRRTWRVFLLDDWRIPRAGLYCPQLS